MSNFKVGDAVRINPRSMYAYQSTNVGLIVEKNSPSIGSHILRVSFPEINDVYRVVDLILEKDYKKPKMVYDKNGREVLV